MVTLEAAVGPGDAFELWCGPQGPHIEEAQQTSLLPELR